jgi:hypothetical protein
LKQAYEIGADSIDSALTVWTRERFYDFIRDYHSLELQAHMFA